ncbi:SDR family NAD(P)-dependent oxidoreductase, partial [Micromonospora sp. NPDC050200]|uniref:SDR family NAD(P)-dependent oxidoreductase n=1 Tax=Micromonospora sp. NPDC050200 TaxID=3155664 RepID=UPI0033ECC16F
HRDHPERQDTDRNEDEVRQSPATPHGLKIKLGARVAITGRNRMRTEAAAAEVRAAGGQVDSLVADLSSQAEVRRLADEALERLPRIDVLVNNAGGYWNTRRITPDGLEHTFAVNHLAPLPAHQPVARPAEAERPVPRSDRRIERRETRSHRL